MYGPCCTSPLLPKLTVHSRVTLQKFFHTTSDIFTDTAFKVLNDVFQQPASNIRGKIKDPTGAALHYYAHERIRPYWSRQGIG